MNSVPMKRCPPEPFPKMSFFGLLISLVVVLLILWDKKEELLDNVTSIMAGKYDKYFVAPDFSSEVILLIIEYFIDTIEVALLGTVLGALIALPFSLMASDMGGSPLLTSMVRSFLAFIRAIPLIFYCFIISRCFGLGMLSGIIAVMIYTLGILSKMFFDEIANLDDTIAHSIMSTGAGRFQVFWYGLLPELLPNFLAFTLLRFEINIREASILGVVGAGGIGLLLHRFVSIQNYAKLWTLIIFFFVVIVAIELLCRWTIKATK